MIGPDSDVGKATLGKSKTAAVRLLKEWLKLFTVPGSLGIELVSWLTEPGTKYSSVQNARLLELADSFSVPAVLTNAVRYIDPDDAITADILDAARFIKPLGEFELQPNAQAWLKPKAWILEF